MPSYDVDFGDFTVEDVEANTEEQARVKALERLRERSSDAEVTKTTETYDVTVRYGSNRMTVEASSLKAAETAAVKEREEALPDHPDINVTAEVEGTTDSVPEIDENGRRLE